MRLFGGLLWLLQPLNRKAKLMVRGRRTQRVKPHDGRDVICVHCASLGEFEQGRPLIEELRKRRPKARIILTFFSPSGYEVRKNYSGVDEVYYLPIDTPKAMHKFFTTLQVKECYIVKYEYWYNMLRTLRSIGAKTYTVSAIYREDSIFFSNKLGFGKFYRDMLGLLDTIFVQDRKSAKLLSSIGVDSSRVVVAGDTRFDRVSTLTQSAKAIDSVAEFADRCEVTVVCGSTWPQDEELLVEVMKARPDWNFIVVPHEISTKEIDRLISSSGRSAAKYSDGAIDSSASLLVIDTIGLLSSIYRYGQLSYIGGGFGAGIHNTLEAAAWGVPVVFGPKYGKFREAVGLLKCGASRSISNYEELQSAFDYYLGEGKSFGPTARVYVEEHLGATSKILDSVGIN